MAYYQVHDNDDELLDEFPIDPEEDLIEEQDLYIDEENVDSDGEPLPSEDEIRNIINSIPSYRFEEATDGYESSMSMSAANHGKKTSSKGQSAAAQSTDSYTERKKKEIKRQEKEVSCSICLEVLRTGV